MRFNFPQTYLNWSVALATFAAALLVSGCAQTSMPTGGPADNTPPTIVSSTPLIGATNFTENQITLEFDEFVKLNNATSELLISPPLKKAPEIKVVGKKVKISWEDTLLSNTTYQFFFGNGIGDLNEGNVLDSNLFVFSTGDEIDTLQITGVLKDAFTLAPVTEALVGLWVPEDSAVHKVQPRYLTKTNEQGEFTLSYLAEGSYEILALKDQNANYRYDLPNESIGFSDSLISASDSGSPVTLRFYEAEETEQYQLSAKIEDVGQFQLIYKAPLDSLEVKLLQPKSDSFTHSQLLSICDTLNLWLADTTADTVRFAVFAAQGISDTVQLVYPDTHYFVKKAKRKKIPAFDPKLTYPQATSEIDYNKPLALKFNRPIKGIDPNLTIWATKSDTSKLSISVPQSKLTVNINNPIMMDSSYTLMLLPNAITDIFGITNQDTIECLLNVMGETDFGQLWVTPKDTNESMNQSILLDLLDGTNVVESKRGKLGEQFAFGYLKTGAYQLRIIVDSNKNGKWNGGNYSNKTQPEQVIIYTGSVEIRSQWESEIDWEF